MMPARSKLEDNWPQMGATLVERWRATHCKRAAFLSVGITAPTLNDWLEKGANGEEPFFTFLQDWEKAEADWIAERCLTIRQAAQGGTWTAAAWDLERHLPDEFGLKQKHEVTGKDGGAVKTESHVTIDFSDLRSDAEGRAALCDIARGYASGAGDAAGLGNGANAEEVSDTATPAPAE